MSESTKISRPDGWRAAGISLILGVICLTVFGQTIGFGFVDIDDNTYVYENAVVRSGLSLKGLEWVFTHADCSLYHPLTMLSLMADYQGHGLRPGGYHLANVFLHTASVILLFLILRQTTGAFWKSAFVAAAFAIHPLRAESVAWVAERKDVLGTFFFMLTLAAYVRYVRRPGSWMSYLTVTMAFVLALLSKPTVVTLPFVLLLLDYWPLRRMESWPRLVREKIPWFALAAGTCRLTVLAAGKVIESHREIPFFPRLGEAAVSYGLYLRQMIWPAGLEAYYARPDHGYAASIIALSVVVLALITAGVAAFRRNRPWLVVGWLWYLGMLLPMANLVQAGAFAHADRMTYLPQIGLFVALTCLSAELLAKWPLVGGGLMAAVLAVLIFFGYNQTASWRNSETLWTHAIGCDPKNEVAYYNLGTVFLNTGREEEAIACYENAARLEPNYPNVQNNLGSASMRKGRPAEAALQFQAALEDRPNYATGHHNLGDAFLEMGKLDDATAQYEKTLEIDPAYAEAHYGLGDISLQKDKVDDAISHFQKALRLKPSLALAEFNLGNALMQKGETAGAIAHFQKALALLPNDARIQNNLAWLLATCAEAPLRDNARALQLARQANSLTGGKDPIILHTFAAALAGTGQFDEAKRDVQKAIDLARATGQTDMAAQLDEELKRYQAGLPLPP